MAAAANPAAGNKGQTADARWLTNACHARIAAVPASASLVYESTA